MPKPKRRTFRVAKPRARLKKTLVLRKLVRTIKNPIKVVFVCWAGKGASVMAKNTFL
ncbi:MAG: hypothetical protein Q7S21_05345 [archaeon]|nr:hypothetical protein [archaeon]